MAINNTNICSIADCDRQGTTRGLCQKHYQRLWKRGTTDERPNVVARFWAMVDRRGPDECWPWLGWINRGGYGQFMVTAKKRVPAHVFAWTLKNGPLPADKPHGLHRCDNPPCCNEAHVFPGTNADNIADRHAKRRDAKGDGHGMTKIPDDTLPQIHARIASGERLGAIARDLGVSTGTISSIKRGIRRRPAHAPSVP